MTVWLPELRATARFLPVLAAATLGMGCAAPATQESQAATESAAPSATPSGAPAATPTALPPTPTPTPTPSPLAAPDAVSQVVTTDLVVRSAPGTGDDSEIYPGALDAPTLLFVVDGPVAASGYDWYLVQPFTLAKRAPPWPDWRFGWVAAEGRDGEDWIAPANLDCPAATLESLADLWPVARLACHGNAPVTIEADLWGWDYLVPGTVSPSWLQDTFYVLVPLGAIDPNTSTFVGLPNLWVHVPNDAPGQGGMLDLPRGTPVRVEGHFDDPAARTCVRNLLPGEDPASTPTPLSGYSAVLSCRTAFVVTSITLVTP